VNHGSRPSVMFLLLGLAVLSGCDDEVVPPEPVALTREASGHYCNMIIVDHPGPKAQVFENGEGAPAWFSSVRDALFYMRLPGEAQRVSAIYVHDMGRASSWEHPQDNGIWIEAAAAVYVIGSSRRGGMGAPETVPFARRGEAEAFVRRYGGKVMAFDEVPTDYLVGSTGDESSSVEQSLRVESTGRAQHSMPGEEVAR
jgi:copper chaperone NosL